MKTNSPYTLHLAPKILSVIGIYFFKIRIIELWKTRKNNFLLPHFYRTGGVSWWFHALLLSFQQGMIFDKYRFSSFSKLKVEYQVPIALLPVSQIVDYNRKFFIAWNLKNINEHTLIVKIIDWCINILSLPSKSSASGLLYLLF